jgi:hypothetical protein
VAFDADAKQQQPAAKLAVLIELGSFFQFLVSFDISVVAVFRSSSVLTLNSHSSFIIVNSIVKPFVTYMTL